jgi:hypothetical protein
MARRMSTMPHDDPDHTSSLMPVVLGGARADPWPTFSRHDLDGWMAAARIEAS